MSAPERARHVVSPTAGAMLAVARAIVQQDPCAGVAHLLRAEREVVGLGADAMVLFEETLAKGCVHALARLGGWRRVHRLADGKVRPMRLWEARPPLSSAGTLAFSPFTFELCRWLVARPLDEHASGPPFEIAPASPGDELFAYLACAMVEGEWLEPLVAAQPGIQRAALARLGFPRMLAGHACPAGERMDALMGDGALVLEAVQDDLARRAVAFERAKATVVDPSEVRRLGLAREANLGALVDACAKGTVRVARDRERWDLVTFMVDAAAGLLAGPAAGGTGRAPRWVATLDTDASLGERAEARRAAGAHLRVLARLGKRHEQARHASFVDDGYDDAQLLLARWEHLGNHGFSRAADVLAGLEAIDGG